MGAQKIEIGLPLQNNASPVGILLCVPRAFVQEYGFGHIEFDVYRPFLKNAEVIFFVFSYWDLKVICKVFALQSKRIDKIYDKRFGLG